MRNMRANAGAIRVPKSFNAAAQVVSTFTDPTRRNLGIADHEGFALDDAIYDPATQDWEFWSFVRLARFIAKYALEHYSAPSVLELGCGPAHLYRLLTAYGVSDYVGVDGNPYFVAFNPNLRGHEEHFLQLDLQEEIALATADGPVHFDVVCCFEVLEHIREDRVDKLIATMRTHMHRDSVLLCTASREAAYDVHVLVRDQDWWLEKFRAKGLIPVDEFMVLRRVLSGSHPFNWSADNTNVFVLRLSAQS